MASERFEMRVPDELMARVDAERGHEKRASFIKRAVEAFLSPESYAFEGERQVVREAVAAGAQGVRVEVGSIMPESVASSGCPECGGLWERREGERGRWCVDCGAREAS
jgi:predicted transcriptional regulator